MSESSKLFKFKNMFNAYVIHTQMKEYLALLIHNGLLEYQKGKKVYLTTRNGLDLLHVYKQMNDLLKG